jgi:hypothetical protein
MVQISSSSAIRRLMSTRDYAGAALEAERYLERFPEFNGYVALVVLLCERKGRKAGPGEVTSGTRSDCSCQITLTKLCFTDALRRSN